MTNEDMYQLPLTKRMTTVQVKIVHYIHRYARKTSAVYAKSVNQVNSPPANACNVTVHSCYAAICHSSHFRSTTSHNIVCFSTYRIGSSHEHSLCTYAHCYNFYSFIQHILAICCMQQTAHYTCFLGGSQSQAGQSMKLPGKNSLELFERCLLRLLPEGPVFQ